MKHRIVLAAASLLMLTAAAPAQQSVEWAQTLNLPKGLNLPKDVKADILGIELGDTYKDAKAKLLALSKESASAPKPPMNATDRVAAENDGVDTRPPLREIKRVFFLPTPGGQRIEASYIGQIELRREFAGAGPRKIGDLLQVFFSAPSSGYQVIAIVRLVNYAEQADQTRIGPMITALKQKFGNEAKTEPNSQSLLLAFQYNDGRAVVTKDYHNSVCLGASLYANGTGVSQQDIPRINAKGECDVSMDVRFNYGISKDHASAIWFTLADNERAKAALTADFAFFRSYIKKLQERTGGAAPKL